MFDAQMLKDSKFKKCLEDDSMGIIIPHPKTMSQYMQSVKCWSLLQIAIP